MAPTPSTSDAAFLAFVGEITRNSDSMRKQQDY